MMKQFASVLLIFFLTASGWGTLWAHGGGLDPPKAQPEATLPELPEATIDEESLGFAETDLGAVDYGMTETIGPEDTEVMGDGPLWGKNQEVLDNGETLLDLNNMAGHDMPQMGKVKPAEHSWVAASQKGYGWALALTLFSGALFGFLTLRRPCE